MILYHFHECTLRSDLLSVYLAANYLFSALPSPLTRVHSLVLGLLVGGPFAEKKKPIQSFLDWHWCLALPVGDWQGELEQVALVLVELRGSD